MKGMPDKRVTLGSSVYFYKYKVLISTSQKLCVQTLLSMTYFLVTQDSVLVLQAVQQ